MALALQAPYAGARDGRGLQHIVHTGRAVGPPWASLCARQLTVARATFTTRIAEAQRCPDCVTKYKEQVLVPRGYVERDGPPGEFVDDGLRQPPRRGRGPSPRVRYTAEADPQPDLFP